MGSDFLPVQIISLFLFLMSFVGASVVEDYDQSPRIVLEDGHMHLVAADDKNIKFVTGNGGKVYFNDLDVLDAVRGAAAQARAIGTFRQETLQRLEDRVNNLAEIGPRIAQLEQVVANGSSVTDLPGDVGTKLKTLSQRVLRLTHLVRQMQTLLNTNECSSNPCRNGGTCEDTYNGFICRCPANWEGVLCDRDVNECAHFAGTDLGCQNGGTCVNTPGSYTCLCTSSWRGTHCTVSGGGCSTNNAQELCGHGTCIDKASDSQGYICICDQGWRTDGSSKACTQDVDECASAHPACSKNPSVECINTPGSFRCGPCPRGYTGNGYYCTDIDECQTYRGGCSNNPFVPCINTQGSFTCGPCPAGYQGDGFTCTFLGACRINNGGCHPLAQCIENTAISQTYVHCVCPSGYEGSGMGPFGCTPTSGFIPGVQDLCSPNPCVHGACISQGNTYMCQCFSGYSGSNCNIQVNPCEFHGYPCQNGGTCIPEGTTYSCRCSSAYSGVHCEEEQLSCGGILTSAIGTLKYPPGSSSRSYPQDMSCTWLIIVNDTKVINVSFRSFHLEDSAECAYDWLQIHDGFNSASPAFPRFCGTTIPNNITSTHNMLFLWFRSDHSRQGDGFELTWNAIDPECGGTINFQSHGTLSSPGYPGKYPPNRDCEWLLRAPSRKRIQLHFFTMSIGNMPNCSFDYVEVLDGYNNEVRGRFCNSSLPAPITMPNNRAIIRFHSDNIGRDSGFQISYSATQESDCGGILTASQGRITPPMEPGTSTYQHRLFCEWEITMPEREKIQLTFERMALESSQPCRFDYIKIYNGRGPEAPLAFTACGSQPPRRYQSTGNVVTVIFKSDHSIADEGFSIRYEAVCGGTFEGESGIITSPMYPLQYPRDKTCIYTIAQPLGRSITLNFQDFELERGVERFLTRRNRLPMLCFDYVEIRDGHDENAPEKGHYCGTRKPDTIISTYNYLWIKFYADSSHQRRGFYANYTTEDVSCGGIVTGETGIIQSPNYPFVYPHNHECRWVIVADEGNIISLEWLNFELEFGCYDNVKIYENITGSSTGQLIGTHCQGNMPGNITSTSNIVTIIFTTDSSVSRRGFQLRFFQQNAFHVCNANFASTMGTITSPNYPHNYPNNKDCTWKISVPVGQQITLNVTDFDLERSPSCNWDYLEIRNGGTETSPLIGKYCGSNILSPITSHSHQMYLRYVTDHSRSGRGFKITWDGSLAGCGGVLRGKSGHIISPNYPQPYGRNTGCSYKIFTSQGSTVQIVFLDFHLESSNGCLFDYLAFYDGEDTSGKLLGKYCSNTHPALVRSTSNKMFITFRTDFSDHGRGFSIKYDTVCDTTITGFHGVIESPNFPNTYPRSLDCNWMINVPRGNKINVTFSHFSLESSISCQKDYVQVTEKASGQDFFTNLGPKLCSVTLPAPISSNSNAVKVEFHSDYMYVSSGFRLEWLLNGCGGQFTKPTGRFTSPGYPNGYTDSVDCEWRITVDLDKSIELTLEDFDVESVPLCNMDYLTIYGGPDMNSPKLQDALCHALSSPMKVTSSGNNMFMKFFADHSYSGRGFSASYKTVDTACGGIFKLPSGSIHSHNYPKNYDPHDDCTWYIEVEKNHAVKLTFLAFNLEIHNNCSYDYVKIFDGNSTDSPVLATLCGNNLPNITTYISTRNTMTVRMKVDGSVSFPGFIANYSTTCGARIVTEDYGIIELSSAINSNRQDNVNCSWIITGSQPSDRVTLTVTHMSLARGDHIESENDCNWGYLEVFDGENKNDERVGQYCGTRIPPAIVSHSSSLMLNLISPYGHHYGYFTASYSVLQGACGGNLTSEHGAFASPNYPDSYPLEIECVWTISASQGNRVTLSFRSFEIEQSDGCKNDYLEIRENGPIGPLIGVFCSDLPTNITRSQTLWIKFYSDNDTTGAGFIADYSSLHGNELVGSSGQIASPLYPQRFVFEGSVTWRITVDFGFAIRLSFERFFIENYIDACHNYLAIYNGYDETAPLLIKSCGGNLPEPVLSSSNIVFVVMSTVGFRGSFFLLNWLQVEISQEPVEHPGRTADGCGGSIFLSIPTLNNTESKYILTSPGYPEGYQSGLTCEWIVSSPPGYQTGIKVNNMDLETHPSCSMDHVSVYRGEDGPDNWKLLKTWCLSNSSSEPPIAGGSLTKIVFKTDYSYNKTGFSLELYPVCGGTIKASNGVIEVNNLTRSVSDYYMECEWNITVRSGRRVRVTFDRFYIHSSQPCSYYLTLRNGHYRDSPVLGRDKFCGTDQPQVNETTSNHLSILYRNRHGGQGFKLRFIEVSEVCGGSFTVTPSNNFVEISSPGFPNSSPPHTECVWTFIAPGGEALQVDFDRIFDFEYQQKDCTTSYVELRDGGTLFSPLIGKFCTTAPDTQKTTGNMLRIEFFSDTDHPHSGFKANVSLARCGGLIRNRHSGELRSPGYPRGYPRNLQCVWRFEPYGRLRVNIQIKELNLPSSSQCENTDHITISQMLSDSRRAIPLVTVCGTDLPQLPEISMPVAIVNFTSFASGDDSYKGFVANYSFSAGGCSQEFNTPYGEIRTPAYPSRIQHDYCSWEITVPVGRRIAVQILDLDIDLAERGSSDLVFFERLWAGRIDSLSVNRTLRYVESSGNTMAIFFYTGLYASRVRLMYTSDQPAVCGGSLDADSGTLDLPLATRANRTFLCEWHYSRDTSSNKTLALTFRNVTFGFSRFPSNYEYRRTNIRIFGAEKSQIIKKLYSNYTSSITVISPFSRTDIIATQVVTSGTLTFSGEYSVHSCGGIISSEESITSPGYPNSYQNDLHCAWSINFPEGSRIKVHFNDFRLEEQCDKDYVIIYNGPLPTSPALDRMCASSIPQDFISQSNSLWVEFHSNNELQFKGFNLTLSTETEGCGGTYHQNNSIIASPQFPRKYPNNAECEWEMQVANGFHIQLTFVERFHIEDSPECANDFVEIYDYIGGNYIFKQKVCGRNIPIPINSTSSRMRVRFRSNGNSQGDGFKAIFSTLCGGIIQNITQGQLISPGYPHAYTTNLFCNYTVLMPGQLIRVQFESFDLESSSSCFWDYVKITYQRHWEGPAELGPYCGTNTPPSFVAKDSFSLIFKTDYSIQANGFLVNFRANSDCGGDIQEPGTLTSPDVFTPRMFEFVNCTWVITAPANSVVVARFSTFSLPTYASCDSSRNGLAFYDGPSVVSRRLGIFCGDLTQSPPVVRSTGSKMVVTYITYSSISQNFFTADILFTYGENVGCGGHLNVTSGSVSSITTSAFDMDHDGNYEPSLDCHWTLTAAPNEVIHLRAIQFDLKPCINVTQNSTDYCTCDFLEVRDGGHQFADLFGKFCGERGIIPLASSSNQLWLRLKTDGEESGHGFTLEAQAQTSPCSMPQQRNARSIPQVLTSPNYPNNYPANIRCQWLITVPRYERLAIHIEYLNISGDQACTTSKLQFINEGMNNVVAENDVYYGRSMTNHPVEIVYASTTSHFTQSFCGEIGPSNYYSYPMSGSLSVLFSANENVAKGFNITYSKTGCNRNYTTPSGRILMEELHDHCFIVIETTTNRTISLYFSTLHTAADCESSGMEVNDGARASDPQLARLCGSNIPSPIFSTGNVLWLHMWNNNNYGFYMDVTYTTTDQGRGCGGNINNYGGVFTSPMYPMNFRNGSDCRWNLTVSHNLVVALTFREFQIGPASTCETDFLEVIEIDLNTDTESVRAHYCGGDNPSIIESQNNRLAIRYKTSVHNGGTGWVAYFMGKPRGVPVYDNSAFRGT